MIDFININIGSDVKADVLLKYNDSLNIGGSKNCSSTNKLFKEEINICIDKDIENVDESIEETCDIVIKHLNKCNHNSLLIDLDSFTNEDTNITYIASVFVEKFKELDTLKNKYKIFLPIFNKNKKSLINVNDFIEENNCFKYNFNVSYCQNANINSNTSNRLKGIKLRNYISEKFRNYKCNAFSDILENMIIERANKGIIKTRTSVRANAGISSDLFSKMQNGKKGVTRRDVAGLAIALKLNIDEAENFYHLAGYHLTDVDLFDVAIRLSIKAKLENCQHVNEYIYDINECLKKQKISIPYLGALSDWSHGK